MEEAIKKLAELVEMKVEAKLAAQITSDFLRNIGSLPLLRCNWDFLWKSTIQGKDKS